MSDATRPESPLEAGSIVLVRALALGDLLCAVPAFRAVRAAFPGAHVALLGLPWATAFVDRFSDYLDEHLEFPGYPGIPEAPFEPRRSLAGIAELQRRRFDLAVALHGVGPRSTDLARLIGARRTVAFAAPGGPRDDPDAGYPAPGEERHEIHRWLDLLAAAGIPARGDGLEFPLREDDHERLRDALDGARLRPGSYAVVHPGASTAARRWPAVAFARVAEALAARGLDVILTGTAQEAPVTRAVAAAMAGPSLDLAGRTDLGALAALIDGAALVVGNDTGPAHLAVACDTPSVVVFTTADPRRWAPLDGSRHAAVGEGARGPGGPVPVDAVLEAIARLPVA